MKWRFLIVAVLVVLAVSVSGGTAFATGPEGHDVLPPEACGTRAGDVINGVVQGLPVKCELASGG